MTGWTRLYASHPLLQRPQVELFCVDHLVVAEIACNEEFLFLEFISPTNKVALAIHPQHKPSIPPTKSRPNEEE